MDIAVAQQFLRANENGPTGRKLRRDPIVATRVAKQSSFRLFCSVFPGFVAMM
jgi:hypothetical protein